MDGKDSRSLTGPGGVKSAKTPPNPLDEIDAGFDGSNQVNQRVNELYGVIADGRGKGLHSSHRNLRRESRACQRRT